MELFASFDLDDGIRKNRQYLIERDNLSRAQAQKEPRVDQHIMQRKGVEARFCSV